MDTYTGHTRTKSEVLPVPFEDVRRQLRMDDLVQDDDHIRMIAMAVCDDIERQYNAALITQTIVEKHSAFPAKSETPIWVAIRPGLSVTSVAYIDSDGASQTFSSSDYDVSTTERGMYVIPKVDKDWPTDLAVRPDAVTITYQAGYGTIPTNVPAAIRLAVLNRVGKYDADREDAVSEKATASDSLLHAFYQFKA